MRREENGGFGNPEGGGVGGGREEIRSFVIGMRQISAMEAEKVTERERADFGAETVDGLLG